MSWAPLPGMPNAIESAPAGACDSWMAARNVHSWGYRHDTARRQYSRSRQTSRQHAWHPPAQIVRGRRRITGAVGSGYGLTMVSKRLYVDHLSKVDLFSEFSRKDLEKVASAGTHVSFPADTTLVRQDESGLEAFVVLSGEVNVKRNGRSVLTAGPGSVLGELSLLDHGTRTASAICRTDCEILVLSAGQFAGLVLDTPALASKLLTSLARRVRELDSKSYG